MKSKEYELAENFTKATIQRDEGILINKFEIFHIPIGFCPVGVTQMIKGTNNFLVTDYFGPNLVGGTFLYTEMDELMLYSTDRIGWVAVNILEGAEKVRLFPENMPGTDAKRAQAVATDGDAYIFTTRNNETGTVSVIALVKSGSWVRLSPLLLGSDIGYIESMTYMDEKLFVLRSVRTGGPNDRSWLESYHPVTGEKNCQTSQLQPPPVPLIYGIGFHEGNAHYVTAYNCKGVPRGIYRGNKLVVPDVWGNGIAFLDNGSAIVTQYAYDNGPFGGQNALVRVPAQYFNA